jgi:hypothetical protein
MTGVTGGGEWDLERMRARRETKGLGRGEFCLAFARELVRWRTTLHNLNISRSSMQTLIINVAGTFGILPLIIGLHQRHFFRTAVNYRNIRGTSLICR